MKAASMPLSHSMMARSSRSTGSAAVLQKIWRRKMKQAKRIWSRAPHFDEVKSFATRASTVSSNVFTEIFKRAIGLPQFNVKSYGAKGDGATDDSTAIQDAINAANTAGGGVVFSPAGTYQINTSLNLKTKVIMMGSGYASK